MNRRKMLRTLAAIPAAVMGAGQVGAASLLGGIAAVSAHTPGGFIPMDGCAAPMPLSFAQDMENFWADWSVDDRRGGALHETKEFMDPDIAALRSISNGAKRRMMVERTLSRIEERQWRRLLKRHNMGWLPLKRPF